MPDVLAPFAASDCDERRKLIERLRDGHEPAMHSLADILATCHVGSRCRSAACSVCSREFQRRNLRLADEVIRKPARERLRNRTSFVTMIPANCMVAPDALTIEVCRHAIEQVKAGLRAVGLPAVGTLDISFNEDAERETTDHWCAHGAAIVLDWLTPEQEDALKALFPKSSLVSRPVQIADFDQRETGRAYALKPDRFRRVSFIERNHPTRNPYRDTKRRSLRPWQATQLALVEHQLGLKNRLITNRINQSAVNAAFDGFYHPRDGP